MIKDGGEKIESADKENLEQKVKALKDTIATNNVENIKKDMEELQKVMYEVSTKMYQKAAPQQDASQAGQGGQAQGQANDGQNVYDADYKDVDNNK